MTNRSPSLNCLEDDRRAKTRAADWNGIDYLEVSDDQVRLDMYFLGRAPSGLRPANVIISGGRRVIGIEVQGLRIFESDDPRFDDYLQVTVDRPGDHADYRICLVELDERGRPTNEPLAGFDPRYACIDFNFKSGCPSSLDCAPTDVCPEPDRSEPEIDYLARDYTSLRTLLLDRLSLLIPDWSERHVADLGITLVELLAYAGDRLSYYQDAVATEAYLATARQRVSVRRHARLVDYWMHEGTNARAWLCLTANTELTIDLDDVCFVASDMPPSDTTMTPEDLAELPELSRKVFEPIVVADPQFRVLPEHNRLLFYTWGDFDCCLPAGATSATLVDSWVEVSDDVGVGDGADDVKQEPPEPPQRMRTLDLQPGDVLIFEEVIGPGTGKAADADPARRHAVCLTEIEQSIDPVCDQPVVEVSWAIEDALPFPLCLSTIGPAPECEPLTDISVACGNVILVDHGLTSHECLGEVPTVSSEEICGDECCPHELLLRPGRFRPRLDESPVTQCEPLDSWCPASEAMEQDPRHALAQVGLKEKDNDETIVWTAVRDLLASMPDERHFVVEVDNRGRSTVRFGDGGSGRAPDAGSMFHTSYRVGNGATGNVGAEAINRIVFKTGTQNGAGLQVRNPLPADGGRESESIEDVKLFAPHAFRRVLDRAIATDDYVAIVERDFAQVQRAAASLQFTGSHTEVIVAIDQLGVLTAEAPLLAEVTYHLERFRRIGHDVRVVSAEHVPLDVDVVVCAEPDHLREHVADAVRKALGNRRLPDGTLGFFHPDRLSFGTGVHASLIVAEIQAVDGVESVRVAKLERLFQGPRGELEKGVLETGPFEIARLDNDPSLPENGLLTIEMRGGR